MRGNVWITFLCEGPRHAPPPALAGGGVGEERASPPGPPPPASVIPRTSPHLPGLSLDGLSLQAASTPALLTLHQPFLRGTSPCVPPSLSRL